MGFPGAAGVFAELPDAEVAAARAAGVFAEPADAKRRRREA